MCTSELDEPEFQHRGTSSACQISTICFSVLFSAQDAEFRGPHRHGFSTLWLLVRSGYWEAVAGDQRIEESGVKLVSGWLWPSPLRTALRLRQRNSSLFSPGPAVEDSISSPGAACFHVPLVVWISTLFNHIYAFSFSPNRAVTLKHSGPTFAHFPASRHL